MAHIFGLFGIAEIQIVGERQRQRAARRNIAPGLRHSLLAALDRIGLAITLRDICCQGEAFRPIANADHAGIAAGLLHAIAEDEMIILFPDPALGAEIGRSQKMQECIGIRFGRLD